MTSSAVDLYGPLLRLNGLQLHQLPPTPQLETFMVQLLTEAIPFIDTVAPRGPPVEIKDTMRWKCKNKGKKFPSSDAPVELYDRVVTDYVIARIPDIKVGPSGRFPAETWVCRRSVHEDRAAKGSASWDEFVYAFKQHHLETEDAFTPTVIGARIAVEWMEARQLQLPKILLEQWGDVTFCIVEMKHKIEPKPLKNRTFPVLQVTASSQDANEFIIVSIPITDFGTSPNALYAKDKSLVVGRYVSVERIRQMETGQIEWIMATASNAGGVLPQWVQNMAVPNEVAKDVELFMSWIERRRRDLSQPPPTPPPNAQPAAAGATLLAEPSSS